MDLNSFLQSPSAPFVALGGGAGVWAFVRNYWTRVRTLLRSRMISTVEIRNNSSVFDLFSVWLDKQNTFQRARALSLAGYRSKSSMGVESAAPQPVTGSQPEQIHLWYLPTPGSFHRLKWDGHRFLLSRSRTETDRGEVREAITIYHVNPNPKHIQRMIHHAIEEMTRQEVKMRVMVNVHSEWRMVREAPLKSPDSVILPSGVMDMVLSDVRRFLANRALYESLSIPHRRGYLFHGLPGSGKSSLAQVIASETRSKLFVLSLNSVNNDNSLRQLMTWVDGGSVLLLEDIDAAFTQRENKDGESVSFSGLLNALDGVAAQENSAVILTTNHKDKLDPALIRAGRVDLEIEFTYATDDQIARLASRLVPREDYRDRALAEIKNLGPVSMATAQGVFLRYRDECERMAS